MSEVNKLDAQDSINIEKLDLHSLVNDTCLFFVI